MITKPSQTETYQKYHTEGIACTHHAATVPTALNNQLAAATKLTAEVKAQVIELRNKGEELHKAGKHAESEEMLEDALQLIGNAAG